VYRVALGGPALTGFLCPGHRGRRRWAELFEAALPDEVRTMCHERSEELASEEFDERA
jgi:hypothetical protein